jgi:hypothetical protein
MVMYIMVFLNYVPYSLWSFFSHTTPGMTSAWPTENSNIPLYQLLCYLPFSVQLSNSGHNFLPACLLKYYYWFTVSHWWLSQWITMATWTKARNEGEESFRPLSWEWASMHTVSDTILLKNIPVFVSYSGGYLNVTWSVLELPPLQSGPA